MSTSAETAVEKFLTCLADGGLRVVDLTTKLSADTPTLRLPAPYANLIDFSLEGVSEFDDAGPLWRHNNIHTGEHIGTHLDAPRHWISNRDGADVSEVPVARLIGPAHVLDVSARVAEDPDFLLEIDDIRAWETEHGPLRDGGWLLVRSGWERYGHDREAFLNTTDGVSHTPGISAAAALARRGGADRGLRRGNRRDRRGQRVRARPADARAPPPPRRRQVRHHLVAEPRFAAAVGRARRGVPAADRRRDRQPGAGARGGARRGWRLVNVAKAVGAALVRFGVRQAFGVVGSGNFHVTNGLVRGGAGFVAARHEGGATTMADAYARCSGEVAVVSVHQGCGLANATTGLGEAAKSRTPLIAVTGEATDPLSNFHLDQDGLARAVGAVSVAVRSAESALADVRRAFTVARRDRRTVLCDFRSTCRRSRSTNASSTG